MKTYNMKPKLNILFIIPYFIPAWRFGGPVRGTYEVAKRLIKQGHKVTVYTTDVFEPNCRIQKKSEIIDRIQIIYFKNFINYISIKFKIFFPIGFYNKLNKEIKSYDIIHIQEYYTFLTPIAYQIIKKNKKPYLISIRGVLSPIPRQSRAFIKKIFDFCFGNILKNSNRIIVQTKTEKKDCERFGLKNISIIKNGITTEQFKKLPNPNKFRLEYNIKKSDILLLFIGRINEIKGLKYLISAIPIIKKKVNISIKLFLIGPDDNYLKYINQIIKQKNLSENITIINGLYGIKKFEALSSADIFILPSIYDCSPNSMLEACSSGLPIITTDQNGLSDLINNKAGIVVKSKNPLRLAQAIIKLINNPKLRLKYGRYGKKMVFTQFPWEQISLDLEKIYFKILDESNKKGKKSQ